MSRTGRILVVGLILAAVPALIALSVWKRREAPPAVNAQSVQSSEVSGDVNWIIPANEIESVRQRATAGDNDAAAALAGHYRELRQPAHERRWLVLAANRGDCGAMSLLMDRADQTGDRRSRSRWNEMLRRHTCTLGNVMPGALQNSAAENTPLWDD